MIGIVGDAPASFGFLEVKMFPVLIVREPVGCLHCQQPLIVLSRQTEPTEPLMGMFSFVCPACGTWNSSVALAGAGVQRVMVDPRRSPRY